VTLNSDSEQVRATARNQSRHGALTVGDVLGFGLLQSAVVLAGQAGIGRPVQRLNVMTDLALLDFEPQTRHMRLTAVQPGVSATRGQEATGFPQLVADDIRELAEPSEQELGMLGDLSGVSATGSLR
jgi:hypothetical protein